MQWPSPDHPSASALLRARGVSERKGSSSSRLFGVLLEKPVICFFRGQSSQDTQWQDGIPVRFSCLFQHSSRRMNPSARHVHKSFNRTHPQGHSTRPHRTLPDTLVEAAEFHGALASLAASARGVPRPALRDVQDETLEDVAR